MQSSIRVLCEWVGKHKGRCGAAFYRLVSGHGFSRAEMPQNQNGLQPLRETLPRRTISSMSWIGWAILSAVFAAATALLAKVGVAHVDSNLATALRTSVVVVFSWAIVFAFGAPGVGPLAEIRSLDRRTMLFLTLSGLATGLSWLCYFRALQLGPASRVAPIDKLSVPLVIVFAWLLLGEKLNASAVVGGLLITAGAVVIALG